MQVGDDGTAMPESSKHHNVVFTSNAEGTQVMILDNCEARMPHSLTLWLSQIYKLDHQSIPTLARSEPERTVAAVEIFASSCILHATQKSARLLNGGKFSLPCLSIFG
jgi:hypothetical protein